MELAFEERLAQLREITRGNRSYGVGGRFEQSTRYYLDNLVHECAQRARAVSTGLPDDVSLLITMVGHSPRLAILSYLVLRPRRLLIISSDEADGAVDTIDDFVRSEGRLRGSEFAHRSCLPTDPMGIYELVRAELAGHARRADETAGEVVIDITAGRKVMGASASLAAWQLDIRLCYVDGDYIDGRAEPGSDRLLILDNPSTLFGVPAMAAAHQAFAGGAFAAANEQFDALAGRLAKPAKARFMAALSELYRAWCDLDFDALPSAVEQVRAVFGPARREISEQVQRTVYTQLDYLVTLANGNEHALTLCFSLLADHYHRVGRYDFAALFSYRLLESCFAQRLKDIDPFFVNDKYVWKNYPDSSQLRQRYGSLKNLVVGDPTAPLPGLPRRSEVLSSAVLLAALDDDLACRSNLSTAGELQSLQAVTEARNKSVLAHGKRPVSEQVFLALRALSLTVLQAYWALSRPGENPEDRRTVLTFLGAGI